MSQQRIETHLASLLAAHPLQSGPLLTAFRDLALSVEWSDLRALELPGSGWTVIIGHKRRSDPLRVVLPLPLHTTALKPSSLKSIFASLSALPTSSLPGHIPPLVPDIAELRQRISLSTDNANPSADSQRMEEGRGVEEAENDKGAVNGELDREMIYMAIVTSDSTVVYYKLSKGIKKPSDIPDE